MGKILCATRGGEASYRTQDAVIARAKRDGSEILFLYVVDVEFLSKTARAVRLDVVHQEMERMGRFLLAMACERAAKQGVEAQTVLSDGTLAKAMTEVARQEDVTLIAFGRPAKEGGFSAGRPGSAYQKDRRRDRDPHRDHRPGSGSPRRRILIKA